MSMVQEDLFEEQIPFPMPINPDFTFIDLFAGIGGFRVALQDLGGKCVFTSEWNKFSQITYEANYDDEPFGDITLEETKQNIPPAFDVLCAGFPCQPFSQAGLKKGFEDTRGTLFFDVVQILQERQKTGSPVKIVFLENVKGLRNHDKGRTLAVITRTLSELGYEVKNEVLNSKYFGIPQNRERIFIVAWLKDLNKDFEFPYGLTTENELIFNKEMLQKDAKKVCLGDILEDDVPEKYTISDKLYAGHLRRKEEHKKKGNGFGFSLFDESSPYTSTISARYYKDGSEIMIDQKEKNPRKLTPREACRLQGYDDSFVIPVSDTQAYQQFGNSVSVPVIRSVFSEIKRQLL